MPELSSHVVTRIAFEWLVENERHVRRLARRMARGRADLEDDLFAVATDRVPRLFELWDETRGVSITGYVMHQLAWYMFKERRRIINGLWHEPMCLDAGRRDRRFVELEARDWVQWFMGRLAPDHARLLWMKHARGMTLAEMGRVLGVSKCTARNWLMFAEQQAAEVLDGAV